jgi:hypothetical protein
MAIARHTEFLNWITLLYPLGHNIQQARDSRTYNCSTTFPQINTGAGKGSDRIGGAEVYCTIL